jgi:hypothetical protein
VSVVAVIVPVTAIVLLAAWFIRVYVAPATVLIPTPAMITAETMAPPAPARAEIEAPKAMAESASPASVERSTPASALPMFQTLALAPPSLGNAPPQAYSDPAQDASAPTPSIIAPEPAELEAAEPIAGPVPLPRVKPTGPIALVASAIPLPRPRPTDAAPLPADDLPAVDRHGVP